MLRFDLHLARGSSDSCDPQQFWDADEIVGSPAQDEEAVDPFHAAKLDLASPGYCLDPAKASSMRLRMAWLIA